MKKLYRLFPVLILLVISCRHMDTEQSTVPTFLDFKGANEYVSERIPSLSGWCTIESLPESRIVFDTKNKTVLFYSPINKPDTIGYQKRNYNIVSCNDEDVNRLCEIIYDRFEISKKEDFNTVNELSEKINAKITSLHAKAIQKDATLDWYDIFLSVLYNACVGNTLHSNVLACRDNKLLHINESYLSNDHFTFLDTTKFKDYVNSGIDLKGFNTSEAFIDSLWSTGVLIRRDRSFDYVFYDIRADSIFAGPHAVKYNDSSVKECKDYIIENPGSIIVVLNGDWSGFQNLSEMVPELNGLTYISLNNLVKNETLQPTDILPSEDLQESETVDRKAGTLRGLICGMLICVIAFVMYRIYFDSEEKEKKMNIKNINELVDQLIVLYQSDSDKESDMIDILVAKLQNLCGKDFDGDFKGADDLIQWKKEFNERYNNTKRILVPAPAGSAEMDGIPVKSNPSIEEILYYYDQLNHTDKLKEFQNQKDSLNSYKNELNKYETLKKLSKKDNITIKDVLDLFAKQFDLNVDLQKKYDLLVKDVEDYKKCKQLIGATDEMQSLYKYMYDALFAFFNSGQTIESAVDYVEKFSKHVKLSNGERKSKEDILRIHNTITQIVSDYNKSVELIIYKDNLDYWDRLLLILASINKCAVPVLSTLKPDNKIKAQLDELILGIKNDILTSYICRLFLRDSQNKNISAQEFHTIVSEKLQESLSKFNSELVDNDPTNSIILDKLVISDKIKILETSLDKNRGYESMLSFIDSMWNYFVKDFCEKAKTTMDESFIIEKALNIAFITSDFLNHLMTGKDIIYCYNYAFLLNGFDPEKTRSYEFKYNDYSKSTDYSNFIYNLAEKNGVEHLKVLIDNYFIKP